ncbi:fumarylacetoacetate hydrolase family protein [Cryptosporangium aurantiacum]|uniref:2-keto-4-pentenoate hydratase/2-oxohepta-3-ene-1,7-dioic acid hydratase (Catechol pathway) n=1 Tax=Cryptosporangium aurantiacum TaxID=134849 RepID=A0A1M7P7R1_9ACTN|nr:fumarylacetoacetate hydrolase family protein [Cryptosporangium aurantiacum]SHN12718.1 2-keto-4-pentenoate hydratase/2-oxohepta-3-ene-1,7-dioic acid hydratase (catechol pathway) [Cryptosporangium aurantiacum]
MRLAHSRISSTETVPVVGRGDRWYDLRPLHPAVGPAVLTLDALAAIRAADLPEVDAPTVFAPPLTSIGKIVCIGLNYTDHAAETGATPPAEPILFMKAPDTVVGPTDDVLIPRASVKTDYEVELAVVIGTTARYLASADEALAHVAGYAISNDVSEREFQIERGGQWDKGKNCETFNPFGPWITTTEDIPDPQDLGLRLWVNGELRQDGTTKDQIFGVAHVVWYLSQFMTLYPGDVINTGTPAGVALGRPDGGFLRDGDVVELEISGLGRQRQTFRQA